MADLWRVTYMGEGVKPTEYGAFAKYVTAFVAEDFARPLAGEPDWIVADPSGNELGSRPQPKKAEKPEEKKPEKIKTERREKPPEKAAEKAEKK